MCVCVLFLCSVSNGQEKTPSLSKETWTLLPLVEAGKEPGCLFAYNLQTNKNVKNIIYII